MKDKLNKLLEEQRKKSEAAKKMVADRMEEERLEEIRKGRG